MKEVKKNWTGKQKSSTQFRVSVAVSVASSTNSNVQRENVARISTKSEVNKASTKKTQIKKQFPHQHSLQLQNPRDKEPLGKYPPQREAVIHLCFTDSRITKYHQGKDLVHNIPKT